MSQNTPVRAGSWTGRVSAGQLRIGDAERDQAVSELSDHFVAGRLTQVEFEERSDLATRARYADDLRPLFADLPDPDARMPVRRSWSPGNRPVPPPLAWLAPVILLGLVVTTVVLTVPWVVWVMFWVLLFSGRWHRRWHHHGAYHRPRR
jgi:hypothetical protein